MAKVKTGDIIRITADWFQDETYFSKGTEHEAIEVEPIGPWPVKVEAQGEHGPYRGALKMNEVEVVERNGIRVGDTVTHSLIPNSYGVVSEFVDRASSDALVEWITPAHLEVNGPYGSFSENLRLVVEDAYGNGDDEPMYEDTPRDRLIDAYTEYVESLIPEFVGTLVAQFEAGLDEAEAGILG